MKHILKVVFEPHGIVIFVSLFLAFSNIFIPKYFLDESDFRDYRLFFNIANQFGPILLLGVDLSVGFIKLNKLIGFIKFYLIFIFFSILILVIGESINSEFNTIIIYGVLFVGAIHLIASLLLKDGKINSFYFFSQIYLKLIPISALFLSFSLFGNFDIDFSILLACLFLSIPLFMLIPYLRSSKNIAPSISVLDSRVVGMVFGTIAIDLALRLPYLLSLNGEPAISNLIDIVTAFTSILLYPAMLYSRKIEVSSEMKPVIFYEQIRSGHLSISLIQLLLGMIGAFSIWYLGKIGLISFELGQLLKIGFGLAFASTILSVIPSFIKLYILQSFDNYRINLLWLGLCFVLSASFIFGYINDVILLGVIFVFISFICQYSIAVKWTGSYGLFIIHNSLILSIICLFMFIFSYQYAY